MRQALTQHRVLQRRTLRVAFRLGGLRLGVVAGGRARAEAPELVLVDDGQNGIRGGYNSLQPFRRAVLYGIGWEKGL